jgi:hypothetical protein
LLTCRAHGLVTQPPSAASGTCEQILDGFADLHELIQTGRLEDELGNPFSYISVGALARRDGSHGLMTLQVAENNRQSQNFL